MWEMLRQLYTVFAAVPPIGYVITYGMVRFVTKSKAKAHRWAMDVTAFFLLSAVSVLWYNVTGGRGWLAVLTMYVLLGFGLGLLQWWVRGHMDIRKWFIALWRMGFVFLVLLYLLLFVIGIFKHGS